MLRELKLLPTEYLYYYYRPEVALANMKRAGSEPRRSGREADRGVLRRSARAKALALQNDLERYQQYLAARDSSYMQLETGSAPRIKPDWAELSGYDRIALITIRAIVKNQGAIIPLNVANRGTLPFLDPEDIVEVPCRVDANGPQPASGRPRSPMARAS